MLSYAGVTALVVGGIAAGAITVHQRNLASDPCHNLAGRLTGVYDADARRRIEAAFKVVMPAGGEQRWQEAQRALDREARLLTETAAAACQAGTTGKESSAVVRLRLGCLDQQQDELAILVGLLANPTKEVVESAASLVQDVTFYPSDCLDADARGLSLMAQDAPDRSPAAKALWAEMLKAEALIGAGDNERALAALGDLIPEAHAIHADRLEAWLVKHSANAKLNEGQLADSVALHKQATRLAEIAHDDLLAAYASQEAANVQAALGGPHEPLGELLDDARRLSERAGNLRTVRQNFEACVGNIDGALGLADEAIPHSEQALRLAIDVGGPDDLYVAKANSSLAAMLLNVGREGEALPFAVTAVAHYERITGEAGGNVGMARDTVAESLFMLGRPEEARQATQQMRGHEEWLEPGPTSC